MYKLSMDLKASEVLSDIKLVRDDIIDDRTFQEADFGLVFSHLDDIIKMCEYAIENGYDKNHLRRNNTMKTLEDTIEKMTSSLYNERFVAEYMQLKIRYEKLKDFCNRIEVAEMMNEEPPIHDCPLELLREQQKLMGLYLSVLEKRAIIENIVLANYM